MQQAIVAFQAPCGMIVDDYDADYRDDVGNDDDYHVDVDVCDVVDCHDADDYYYYVDDDEHVLS